MTLYDFERDGILKPGETLLFFADGTTTLLPPEKPTAAPEQEEEQDYRPHWSSRDQVFFSGGYAWGTDPNGIRVCLGQERIVSAAILNARLKCKDPTINNIIAQERRMRIGEGWGLAPRSATGLSRRTFQKRDLGGRSARRPEHQLRPAKRAAARPRIPGRPTEQDQPALHD